MRGFRAAWTVPGLLILAGLACSTSTPAGDAEAPTATPVTFQPTPTLPVATDEPSPTDAPAGGDGPVFTGPIRFTTDPNNPGAQRSFPADVQEIWAVWDYSGMSDGDLIRRVWYLNGQPWLAREEAWNFARYGASGTVRDISIYDYETPGGLQAGEYRVQLFINGVEQIPLDATDQVAFSIGAGGAEDDVAFPSPDLSRTAILQPSGTLLLSDSDGSTRPLAQAGEITDVEWFPDGQHLLYVTFDGGNGSPLDRMWDMWVVNVDTGQAWQINQPDERLHDPAIVPQGDVIAVVAGTNYGDAGLIDRQLAFVFLTLDLQRSAVVYAAEFQGIPDDSAGSVHPIPTDDLPLPGEWVSIAEFHAIMNNTWQVEDFEPGVYAFFTLDRMAGCIDDLPEDASSF